VKFRSQLLLIIYVTYQPKQTHIGMLRGVSELPVMRSS